MAAAMEVTPDEVPEDAAEVVFSSVEAAEAGRSSEAAEVGISSDEARGRGRSFAEQSRARSMRRTRSRCASP